jgi:deoxyhypusine monooxygenase
MSTLKELEALLGNPETPHHRRIYACQELLHLGTSGAIALLGRVLSGDPDSVVRHEAAFVLGELADPAGVPALAEAMRRDPSDLVRHESAEALGWIATPESAAALKEALKDRSPEVVRTAEISLAMHREPRAR